MKTFSKFIVIAVTLLIWSVKFIIRPYIYIPSSMQIVVDTAPNLLGSFAIPFGACWFFRKYFRLQTTIQLQFTCVFGLILIIINEYLQLIPIFGRTFDYFDILVSFIGITTGYYVFFKMMKKENLIADAG